MECNRDEAIRSKEIAEIKFSTKDIKGAKKFALKAQNLYPELDGISQLLATLDIYIAAENKINNESDFYAILGVSSLADDDTVRKHYRKLALFLHPDKNKSVGADGAFKHISEAWSLLSDRTKRTAYDQRRQNVGTAAAPPAGQNGFYNFTTSTAAGSKGTSNTKDHKQKTQKTFWTVCHGCKMQYEYLRMYLHQNLLCPNCHEPFLAMETAPPFTKVSTKGFKSQKVKNPANTGKHRSTSQWTPFSTTGSPASSSQAATMVQLAYEKVKREREAAQAAIKREEALKRKKISKRSHKYSSPGFFNSVKKKPEEIDSVKGVSNIVVQTRLVKKARNEIKRKLHEWRSETGQTTVDLKERREETLVNLVNGKSTKNEIEIEPLVIDVPDPDFHNFDRERCERCFKEGEVWAAYDVDDGMPRNYAMIQKVNSVDPFKIKVRWLNFQTNELDLMFEFSKPCGFGEFRTGKHETISVPNYFSHKVNFTKMENGFLQIYPRKGDVWALYRNWSPEWNEETPNEVKHKYEIVEVDEYDEETGFTVTQLIKVACFKTVFHRQINPKELRVIPENEIFRFSHQIPSYLLTGQESVNALKGCRELDPAATPAEFLQVIGDLQDSENIDNDGDDYIDGYDESAVLADVKEVDEEVDVVEESRRM